MKKKSVTTWTLKLNLKREQFCLVMTAKCNDNIGRQHYFLFLSKDYLLEDDQGLSMGVCWQSIFVNQERLLHFGLSFELWLTRH
jgi:hypothetical protein